MGTVLTFELLNNQIISDILMEHFTFNTVSLWAQKKAVIYGNCY
jgi:hypothetical protein